MPMRRLTSPPRQIARMPASLGQRERFRVQENELTLVRGTGFEPATSRVSVWCSTVELTTSRTAVVRTRSRNALRRPQERGAGRRRPGGSFLEIRFSPNKKARHTRNAGLRKSACWHHENHRDRRLDPGTPFWFCMVLPSLLEHQTRGKGKRFAREIVDRLDAATARSGGNARSPRTGRGGQGIPGRTLSHTSDPCRYRPRRATVSPRCVRRLSPDHFSGRFCPILLNVLFVKISAKRPPTAGSQGSRSHGSTKRIIL